VEQDNDRSTFGRIESGKALVPFRGLGNAIVHVPAPHEVRGASAELSDEQLGKEIVLQTNAGDETADRAIAHYKRAGEMLIYAQLRSCDFKAFVRNHCVGISRGRAYELIDIARGKIDEVRAKSNARKRRFRSKQNMMPAAKARVRSGTDTRPKVSKATAASALARFKASINELFPRMDDATLQAALDYATRWRFNRRAGPPC
jgi:hypothetical protein